MKTWKTESHTLGRQNHTDSHEDLEDRITHTCKMWQKASGEQEGYLRVLRVSSTWWWEGLMVAIMAVLELPPRLSFSSLTKVDKNEKQ